MNRSILFGVLSIVATLVFVGGTTYALFSSQASNNGNTFGAGTLSLSINTVTGSGSSAVFTVPSLAPGDSTTVQTFNLKNEGSVNAPNLKLTGIVVNPTPAGPLNLGDKLNLTLYNDTNGNGVFDGAGTDLPIDSGPLTAGGWANHVLPFGLTGGASHAVFAQITFDSSADNTYQGLSASVNFNFNASQ